LNLEKIPKIKVEAENSKAPRGKLVVTKLTFLFCLGKSMKSRSKQNI